MIRKVADRLYRGPRLMPSEYSELQKLNIDSVINLESDENAVNADVSQCSLLGIKLWHFPMSELLPYSLGKLNYLVDFIDGLIKQEFCLYVHCRRGIDRTGQVIAAWQIRHNRVDMDTAYNEQISYGHPELYNLLGWKYVLSKVTTHERYI